MIGCLDREVTVECNNAGVYSSYQAFCMASVCRLLDVTPLIPQ